MEKFNLNDAIASIVSDESNDFGNSKAVKEAMSSSKEQFGKSLSWWATSSVIPTELEVEIVSLHARKFGDDNFLTFKAKVNNSSEGFAEPFVSVPATMLNGKDNNGEFGTIKLERVLEPKIEAQDFSKEDLLKTKFAIVS